MRVAKYNEMQVLHALLYIFHKKEKKPEASNSTYILYPL